MRLHSVSRIATKIFLWSKDGGEIKRKSKVFVMLKRERFSSQHFISFCKYSAVAVFEKKRKTISEKNIPIIPIFFCDCICLILCKICLILCKSFCFQMMPNSHDMTHRVRDIFNKV